MIAVRECKVVSRNQRNLGFEALKRSLAKLPVQNAILDGEIVCLTSGASVSSTSYSAGKRSQCCTHSTFCGLPGATRDQFRVNRGQTILSARGKSGWYEEEGPGGLDRRGASRIELGAIRQKSERKYAILFSES